MPANGKFKPFVGRCFTLKNYTDLKKYPEVILVMDETKKEVMFLDLQGNATWISKFYLRDKPIESRVFATPDTLTEVMGLVEQMRSVVVDGVTLEPKKVKDLNKTCVKLMQQLRDLGTRMQGVKFAPPEKAEEQVAPAETTNAAFERDKAILEQQSE